MLGSGCLWSTFSTCRETTRGIFSLVVFYNFLHYNFGRSLGRHGAATELYF